MALTINPDRGHLGQQFEPKYKHQYNVVDDKVVEVREIVVHLIRMGDVEDPEIYIAEPIWNWQQTEQGKWVMEHAIEPPVWLRYARADVFDMVYCIKAKLTDKDLTYYYLKWGDAVDSFSKR